MKRRYFLSAALKTGSVAMAASHLPLFNIIAGPSSKQEGKLGVALVGLGTYATYQLAPALQETRYCYLAGIVTGTPAKADRWAGQYDIPEKNIYNYETFDEIASNQDIDIIYIVLPNAMHAEYTIRAAQAGKHVICEKPMATSFEDSRRMVEACKKAKRKLSIGYRLHFDPYNLEMMRLGQKQVYGKVLKTDAGFAFPLRDKSRWRLDKEMAGGGPLVDVGIYAMQGTIYTLGALPTALKATDTTRDKTFYDEEEGSMEWQMTFPSGVKTRLKTSYEEAYNYLQARAESGSFGLGPAYSYRGLKGTTPEGSMQFPPVNQQALQMDDYALCVMKNKESVVRGEMGMRDMFLIEKIYESASAGRELSLKGIPEVLHKV